MTKCGMVLRNKASAASSMEAAAREVVRHRHENLIDPKTGEPALALVRLFKTPPYPHIRPHSGGMRVPVLVLLDSLRGNGYRCAKRPEPVPQLPIQVQPGQLGVTAQFLDSTGWARATSAGERKESEEDK